MKYLKTFEAHSIKKDIISRDKFYEILSNSNKVTLPFFDTEESLLHHIEKNFDKDDVAVVENPSKELTGVERDGESIFLYTKKKTYIVKGMSELEFDNMNSEINR